MRMRVGLLGHDMAYIRMRGHRKVRMMGKQPSLGPNEWLMSDCPNLGSIGCSSWRADVTDISQAPGRKGCSICQGASKCDVVLLKLQCEVRRRARGQTRRCELSVIDL